MSYSDSDSSSYGGDYKNFKQITRERLLYEMLRSAKTGKSKSTWKVLIMDKLTVKIMSYSCKMADITQEGISLVEDLYRRRQPLPSMEAIYFIQPTKENVVAFLSDMSGKSPLYKNSPISRELVTHIKKDSTVLPRIGALREMNLEYFAIDSQGFVTDDERALEELFGDEESSQKADTCLNVMATRIATVFASLREFPLVRYRAAKSLDAMTITTFRDLVPTKLAAGVWNCLMKYKQTIQNFPMSETCELLILDRSVDQIAPLIHEWTYDAICHDLLNLEGNKYVHEVPSKTGGPPEKKEVLLEEHDPIWVELRHAHIADASERLHEKMTGFVSKNKAAQIQNGSSLLLKSCADMFKSSSGDFGLVVDIWSPFVFALFCPMHFCSMRSLYMKILSEFCFDLFLSYRDGSNLSTRDLQKLVQALPQYSEQIDKLSLHVEIAGKINRIIRETGLRELGQLEQDIVFGDAGFKDVIKFLTAKEDITRENKLRLLMIVASIYPEKFEGEKGLNLMKLAKLTADDMTAVNNMRLLGGALESKKSTIGAFSLKFDIHKELVEKLGKNELSKDDYPCMNDPSPTFHGTTPSALTNEVPAAHSMRSRRTPTWARPRSSDDGYSSDSVLKHASSDFKKMGQRIFVFIVGGTTRSELRVCHKLTAKLNREVVLGSSSLDDPPQFITKLKMLTAHELSLDDIQI
ncbi:SNARE-interacting protein KEULE [Citrus sinensis]|nr:SNARE-interacting protein KEULE [Citrus sinensis]